MADRSVIIRLKGDVSDFVAKMRVAGASARDALGNELDAIAGEGQQALSDLGDAAGKVGLGAAIGFGAAVGAAANFDQAMSKVAATGADAKASIDELRAAAIQAGADTAFSASEAAAGLENLAKAGVSADDALGGGLAGTLNLAAAGELDVADAAEIAASAMTQFGLAGADVPHIADLLAAGAGKAQGEVSDMGAALNQSGLIAAQVGLTLEETVGTLAEFANAGLVGSDAGTSLKSMLIALTPKSQEAATTMDELGISAYDASGQFVGMEAFAGNLQASLAGLTDQQKASTLVTIFGTDAIRAASIIYKDGAAGIQGWIGKVNDGGFAADNAAEKLDNLLGDLEKFKGSLETALIGTGEGSQGALRGLTQAATGAVNAFTKLPPAMQGTVGEMLAIVAITGGGLFFGAKVVAGIASTRVAMATLATTAPRTAAAMRGVVKAGVALIALDLAGGAIRSLETSAADAVPEVEALTTQLLNLQDAKVAAGMAEDLGDIAGALDRIKNPDPDSKVADSLNNIASKGGGIGTALGRGAAGFVGMTNEMGNASVQLQSAENAITGVDAALAGLVTSASPERAQQAFHDLAISQGLSAEQQKDLLTLLPEYTSALSGSANATQIADQEAAGLDAALGDVSDAMTVTEQAASEEAAAILESVEAMKKKTQAALDALDSELGYAQALLDANDRLEERKDLQKQISAAEKDGAEERSRLAQDMANADSPEARQGIQDQIDDSWKRQRDTVADLREQLKDYKLTLDTSTQAGIDNTRVLKDQAQAWFDQTDAAKNAKGAYKDAKDALFKTARQFGATKREAHEYVRELLDIPTDIASRISIDAELQVHVTGGRNKSKEGGGFDNGFAAGGYTGNGGKYQPAGIVHAGEFVFNAATTKANRGLFEFMHKGYAAGGFVEPREFASRSSAGVVAGMGAGIDYDRLAASLATVRPLYGNVQVTDGYGGFKRQMLADQQAAGLGGYR